MTNWPITKLRGKIHVRHGYPFKGEHFKTTGPYVVLTPGNFHEQGGFKRNAAKDKCYAEPFPDDYLLKKGDLIVAMTEQTDGLLGSTALVPESDRFLHNQCLGLITAQTDDVIPEFLYHLFKTRTVREQIRLSSSGSKVKHTSPDRIYDVQVQLPPPKEQQRIAAVLSALDAKIELNHRINAELEGLAKLLYDYWFVQFEFPLTAAQAAALGKPKPVLGIRETDIIKHCFIYPFILREIPRYMILRTGAQQPHINKGTVDETPLVIPAAETLKAYTAIAAPIFEQIRNLQHQTQELTALRDWLLPLLMNGQVRVG